jgi:hypothetical protein
MLSPALLYATAALLALVAVACTALCLAWSNPTWRRRLAPPGTGGLRGWPAHIGSGLVSAGIAACALVAWYGLYCTVIAF